MFDGKMAAQGTLEYIQLNGARLKKTGINGHTFQIKKKIILLVCLIRQRLLLKLWYVDRTASATFGWRTSVRRNVVYFNGKTKKTKRFWGQAAQRVPQQRNRKNA